MKLKRFLKICVITVTATLIILIPFLWGFLPNYYLVSIAEGDSMYPTLSNDELCVFKMTKNVDEWDIILYSDGEDLIVHRLVFVHNTIFYCHGDNNAHGDIGVSEEQIRGVLIYHVERWKFDTFFISMIIGSVIGLIIVTRKLVNRGD